MVWCTSRVPDSPSYHGCAWYDWHQLARLIGVLLHSLLNGHGRGGLSAHTAPAHCPSGACCQRNLADCQWCMNAALNLETRVMALLKKMEAAAHSGKAAGASRSRAGRNSGGTQRTLQPPTKARSRLPRGSHQGRGASHQERGGSPDAGEPPMAPSGQDSCAPCSASVQHFHLRSVRKIAGC